MPRESFFESPTCRTGRDRWCVRRGSTGFRGGRGAFGAPLVEGSGGKRPANVVTLCDIAIEAGQGGEGLFGLDALCDKGQVEVVAEVDDTLDDHGVSRVTDH